MSRLIEAQPLQQLLALLADPQVPVGTIELDYDDYQLLNLTAADATPAADPLRQFQFRRGASTQPLAFSLRTWNTAAGRAAPNSTLAIDLPLQSNVVGFVLSLLFQDDTYVYIGFRFGAGEGGKNRWFGLTRGDTRTPADLTALQQQIKQALDDYYPSALQPHPRPGLGQWKVVARLALADLVPTAAPTKRSEAKTKCLEALGRTFLIAEKLRDESLGQHPPVPVPPPHAHPLNQILYGPPGTGKTYSTAAYAVAIVDGLAPAQVQAQQRANPAAVRQRYDELRAAGRIQFVTFHQAFSYEDFLEGIKPELSTTELRYQIEPGIFRRLAEEATAAWRQATDPAADPVLDFATVYEEYLLDLQQRLQAQGSTVIIPTKENRDAEISHIDESGGIRLRHGGAPNLYNIGRTWTEQVYARYASAEEIVPMNRRMREIGGPNASLQWALFRDFKRFEHELLTTRFFTLEDPTMLDDLADIAPEDADEATPPARYVLIVDEINRGNVAGIFGELITLLENDKRAGQAHALSLTLPYSKQPFTVPPNLYLLGTMNTADRSVEALDTALRRRFAFTELPPQPQLLAPAAMLARLWWEFPTEDWHSEPYLSREQPLLQLLGGTFTDAQKGGYWAKIKKGESPANVLPATTFTGINLERLLTAINRRLEYLLGRDYRLGHAWLLSVGSLAELQVAFRNKVIPQLQEYFFGSWGRLGQVLGSHFVEETSQGESPLLVFGEEQEPDGRPLYAIRDVDWTADDFRSIYQAVS
jgi:5-methylcytosine-specific restriction protein B